MSRLPCLRIDQFKAEEVVITKMNVEDLDEVLSIEAASSLSPWSKKMFLEELENPVAYCFVMKGVGSPGRQTIGFVCLRNVGYESELVNIAVHPLFRRLGIGRKLMQFYIDFCSTRQIKSFYLEVNASNSAAIRLYRSFSYQPTGVRKNFYQGKFDALLMVKNTESP